jgi:hypothetical protein
VLAFCLLNLIFFITVQPYCRLGDELLMNRDFSQGLQHWNLQGEVERVSHGGGVLTIDHPAKSSDTLAQCWRAEELPQPLLLSAEGRCQGVVQGPQAWHEARVDLVGYDAKGEGLYQTRTRLFGLQGDHAWRKVEALFELPQASQRVCLEISLFAAPGRFQVRQLSLTPGGVSESYGAGWWLLLAGWLVLTAWLLPPLYRYFRESPLGGWLLLAGALLMAGTLMPHELRQQLEEAILWCMALFDLPLMAASQDSVENAWMLWPQVWDLSKYSHLLGFALLASLLAVGRDTGLNRRTLALLPLAVATEILQYFVPLRTPRLSDLVVDLLGILLGVCLVSLLRWIRSRLLAGRASV